MPVEASRCESKKREEVGRAAGEGQPCPACGGALVPLRGSWRCSRCFFALCVGCEVAFSRPEPSDD